MPIRPKSREAVFLKVVYCVNQKKNQLVIITLQMTILKHVFVSSSHPRR